MIIEMTAQVAELRVKVEFLSADNQKLSGNKKILKG
jgi:hypothetical protein